SHAAFFFLFFFFQAEDGIRDRNVTGVQTCALPIYFIRDVAMVASIYRVPQVMEVNPSFSAKTVPEFIAYAKANPGKINFASAGKIGRASCRERVEISEVGGS